MKNRFEIICFFLLVNFIAAGILFAHMDWIRLDSYPLSKGKTATLRLAHGHQFPLGTKASLLKQTKYYARLQDGADTELVFTREKKNLLAGFDIKNLGTYLFYFQQGPIYLSKTTRGWKTGGKDKYPKAVDYLKRVKTGLTYVKTSDGVWNRPSVPGLPIRLFPETVGTKLSLILEKDSKPYKGGEVFVTTKGVKPELIGKTDSKGRISYVFPKGFKDEILFSVEINRKAPTGSDYNREYYATTLLVDFR